MENILLLLAFSIQNIVLAFLLFRHLSKNQVVGETKEIILKRLDLRATELDIEHRKQVIRDLQAELERARRQSIKNELDILEPHE